jgi:hypothetical protein
MIIKNKISTLGYFLKRMRDSGFITIKLYDKYSFQDPRKWSVMVDPGNRSVTITCYENREFKGDIIFEINDGGRLFPKNYNLKTNSMEIIITNLLERGVSQKTEDNDFLKK